MQIELLEIDFNSEEAIYMQLRNQIILGIATSRLQDGDTLPSVRQMAECIGINMHTVNKAYAVLRKEGIVSIDRRKGAVIFKQTAGTGRNASESVYHSGQGAMS